MSTSQNVATRHRTRLVAVAALALTAALGLSACSSGVDASPTATSPAASTTVEALSTETHVNWKNDLDADLTFTISGIDNRDWDGDSRPDHDYPEGINNYTLESGATYDERLEVNHNNFAGVIPTFTLTVSDGTSELFTKTLVYVGDGQRNWFWDDEGWGSVSFTYTDSAGESRSGTATPTTKDHITTMTFADAS